MFDELDTIKAIKQIVSTAAGSTIKSFNHLDTNKVKQGGLYL